MTKGPSFVLGEGWGLGVSWRVVEVQKAKKLLTHVLRKKVGKLDIDLKTPMKSTT